MVWEEERLVGWPWSETFLLMARLFWLLTPFGHSVASLGLSWINFKEFFLFGLTFSRLLDVLSFFQTGLSRSKHGHGFVLLLHIMIVKHYIGRDEQMLVACNREYVYTSWWHKLGLCGQPAWTWTPLLPLPVVWPDTLCFTWLSD